MSGVLQIKTAPGHWSVFVGSVCVGGFSNEFDANCVYRAIDSALARARLAAIDECIAVVASMPPISCETGQVTYRLESLKEKPDEPGS